MPEVSDEELEALRARAAEADSLKEKADKADVLEKSLKATQDQLGNFQQSYQNDMQRVTQYVQNEVAQRQTPAEEPDEETQKLSRVVQEQVAGALNPILTNHFANQRETFRTLAGQKYPDEMGKWGKEVEELLNGYPAQVAASPMAYDAAIKAVRANHLEEILAERMKAGDAAELEAPKVERQERGKVAPVSPTRTVSATRSTKKVEGVSEGGAYSTLGDEDRRLLKDYDISPQDFEKYNSNNYTEDVLGFKGRSRV